MMVGLDVAKAELVVAVRPSGEPWTVAHDEPGVQALAERLRAVQPELIVGEATGGYALLSVGALLAAGLPVVVVNPRHVRDFARATGELAKTDRLDPAVLALFAERVRPAVRTCPRPTRTSWRGFWPGGGSSWRCCRPSRIGWGRCSVGARR